MYTYDLNIILKCFIILFLSLGWAKEIQSDTLSFYDYHAEDIDGRDISMGRYKGKKIMVVNVASKCGFTPQYDGLQKLQEIYGDHLVILGFPSNDFFWQEPGTNSEIKFFCKLNYGVTFQMFGKIHVKGKNQHPIYNWLSNSKLNGWNDDYPSWNFCKYIIDENGNLIEYFNSKIEPMDSLITRLINISHTILPADDKTKATGGGATNKETKKK